VVDAGEQKDVSKAERSGTADKRRYSACEVDQVSNPAVNAHSEDRVENWTYCMLGQRNGEMKSEIIVGSFGFTKTLNGHDRSSLVNDNT
jgi:hypothetical protein